MRIRQKKQNRDGIMRVESRGDIKEVLINEDLVHPSTETISVCFRGKNSSGIIDFTGDEIEKLYNTVKQRIHLIKGVKTFRGSE